MSSVDVRRVTTDVVAADLRPVTRQPVGLSAHAFRDVLSTAVTDRLTGFVATAARDGLRPFDEEQTRQASDAHTAAVLRVLELERTLIDVHRVLSRHGIDIRVLKGPALARTVYDDPQLRTFTDVDVVVPTATFSAAVAALTDAGYRRLRPELRPGFDERFAKTVTMADEDGREVDVHRTLAVGPYGPLIRTSDLFATRRQITIGGIVMPALGPEEQFLHVCYHAALGDVTPRLAVLHDVAKSLLHDDIDVGRVMALAKRWRGLAVLAHALRLAWDTLTPDTVPPIVQWARACSPSLWDRLLLASYSRGTGNGRKYLMTALVTPGLEHRVAYLRALLLPSARVVTGPSGRRASWWMHGLRGLFGHPGDAVRRRAR